MNDNGAGEIEIVSFVLAVLPRLSVTVIVGVNVPEFDGFPTIAPPLTLKPSGKPDAENVYGAVPPVAPRLAE